MKSRIYDVRKCGSECGGKSRSKEAVKQCSKANEIRTYSSNDAMEHGGKDVIK